MKVHQLLKDLEQLLKDNKTDKTMAIVTVNGNPIFRLSYNNNTMLLDFEEGSDL